MQGMVLGRALAVPLTAGLLVVFGAVPASATPIPTPQLVTVSTTTYDSDTKGLVVPCPAGTKVGGAGVDIVGGGGDVTLTQLIPADDLSTLTVSAFTNAFPTGPVTAQWSLTVQVMCLDDSLDLERVEAVTAYSNVSPKTATATCPAGKVLYGVGAEITLHNGQVFFDGIVPAADLGGVDVTTSANPGWPGFFAATAYGICGLPSDSNELGELTSVSNSSTGKGASRACPNGGYVTGIGAAMDAPGSVTIERLVFGDNLLTGLAKAVEHGTYAGNWQLTTYVICAV